MRTATGRSSTPEPPGAGRERGREPGAGANTLRLWREDVSFDRETVETGRVRVQVRTHKHAETFNLPLSRDVAEVKRVPIDREVAEMPQQRRDGDVLVIPVVEERVVVTRKLVLREEVHLRLVRTTEQHQETVELRRQEAVIERLPAEPPSKGR